MNKIDIDLNKAAREFTNKMCDLGCVKCKEINNHIKDEYLCIYPSLALTKTATEQINKLIEYTCKE